MSNLTEEERFSTNVSGLSDLVHDLVQTCWDSGVKDINPILIPLAQSYLSSFDKKELIDTFIGHSHNFWDEIRSQNENFFIEHSKDIFGKLPVDAGKIDAFKMLFTSKNSKGEHIIVQEDRDAIWYFFECLVKICVKYVHRIRDCYLEENKDGKMLPRYRHNKFPEIKVREYAKKFDINLEMPKI